MPEISELAFDFSTLIPALVFAALAAVLPELYKFLARKFLGLNLKPSFSMSALVAQ